MERDPALARRLRRRFADVDDVSVHGVDIASVHLPRRPIRVVADLPFAGSNALPRRLLASGVPLAGADVIVAWGVAVAWASPSPRCELVRRLRPSSFVPAPACDAGELRIRR